MLTECLGCGAEFIKEWPDHSYCSDECALSNFKGQPLPYEPEPEDEGQSIDVRVIPKKPIVRPKKVYKSSRRLIEPAFRTDPTWAARARESERRIIEKYGVKPLVRI